MEDGLSKMRGQPARAANPVGSLLDADAPGDDPVFRTDADRHENVSRNGSSGFGGSADSAEVADLAARLRAHVLAHVVSEIGFPGGVPRSDKYHKPKRAGCRYVHYWSKGTSTSALRLSKKTQLTGELWKPRLVAVAMRSG